MMNTLELFPESQVETAWFDDALNKLDIQYSSGWPDLFGEKLQAVFRNKRKIRTLSLFSGGGGLDIGFHQAGFDIVECNEIVPEFAKTLEMNAQPGGILYGSRVVCQDINTYDPDLQNIDFIIGGPPCQTFSAAGARAAGVNGTDDERGNLFLQYARIIYKLQPAGFLFENVYRVIGAQSGKAWEQIQAAFEELGYTLHWRILDAADYGVPQFRERLIIVGLKKGNFNFPSPSHGPDSHSTRDYYSAADAIAGVTSAVVPKAIGGRHGHLLEGIPAGLNYSFYTEKMGHPTPWFAWRSKFSDYLYKADPERPVRTLKAQGGQYTGPFSWENRPFSVEELKRLQTFPDSYQLNGARQKVIHQLGNSVPPHFARILALSIRDQVFSAEMPFALRYMDESVELGFRARKSALTKVYAQKASEAIARLTAASPLAESWQGQFFFSVDSDLRVKLGNSKDEADYCVDYAFAKGTLTITLHDEHQSLETEYGIHVRFTAPTSGISAIMMHSYHFDKSSLLLLWKALEIVARKHLHKDDLVQLFGYYQYKNRYHIEIAPFSEAMQADPFWQIYQQIAQGNEIGEIIDIGMLCQRYGCSLTTLTQVLIALKNLGFEIRNSNTNKQIKKGMVLIPYPYPTLNERSLQRLTIL